MGKEVYLHSVSNQAATEHLELYRRMWMLRLLDMAFEELSIGGLIPGPSPTGFGQEAVGIGGTAALCDGDLAIVTHRPHAQRVGLGFPLGSTIAAMFDGAKRAASPPWSTPAPGVVGGVAEQSPLLAVGHAYAQWLADEGRVTLCVIGDGDVHSAEFTQAANMAVLWRLPVVFFVANIRSVLSGRPDTHSEKSRLYRKAAGYGMPGRCVDGNDVEAVRHGVAEAVERARSDGGPTLVEAVTYRTTDLPEADRGASGDLARSERFLDPLIFSRQRLISAGVMGDHLDEVERTARGMVADAMEFATAALRRTGDGLTQTSSRADGHPDYRF